MQFLQLPNEIIGYICEFILWCLLTSVNHRIHHEVHLRSVSFKNFPSNQIVQTLETYGKTEALRLVLTEPCESAAPLQNLLQKLQPTLRRFELVVFSPSLALLQFLATVNRDYANSPLKALTIQFRTRREVAEKMAEVQRLVLALTRSLPKFEFKLVNCQIADLSQQVIPHFEIPERVEVLSVDLYRNALLQAGMRSLMADKLRLAHRPGLQELNLDFSADQGQTPDDQFPRSAFYLVTGIKTATSVRKLGLTLNDCQIDVEVTKSLMEAFDTTTALSNLRSLTLRLNNNVAIGDAGVAVIVARLISMTCCVLRNLELHLQNVGLTDEGARHLCHLAQAYTLLDHLRLLVSYNGLSDDAVDSLERSAGKHLASFHANTGWQITPLVN